MLNVTILNIFDFHTVDDVDAPRAERHERLGDGRRRREEREELRVPPEAAAVQDRRHARRLAVVEPAQVLVDVDEVGLDRRAVDLRARDFEGARAVPKRRERSIEN